MSTITLTTPGPRQRISIPAEPKATIHLDFQADQATLERSGDNLVFSFADGGSIAIEGFYAQYDKTNLPEFAVDGKILPGSEFFNAFGPDLAPAAGPAAQAAERGARYNEHSDSSLASGLGHLDGAETPTLNVSAPAEIATLDPTLAVTRGTGLGAIAGPGSDISGPQGPSFPSGPFVRAVLYGNGQSGEYVSTNVFFAENNGTPSAVSASDLDFTGAAPWARFSVTVTLPDGWQNAWVDVAFDYTTGRLEFRLTPEGIAEMQRLGVTGKPLVDFIQITVLDRGTGDTFNYNVELIATKDQEFDSAAHDSQYGGNVALDNIGEFHQGQNGGGAYSIISSTKNDEIILNDTLVGGSSIHASGSADPALMADDYNTINLNAGVSNTTADSITRVTSTDGILKVQGGVSAQGDNTENFISMGKGQVHINNASGHGINAVAGENTILGRELLVNASDKGIYAEDGGSNTVETKGGDVSINAEGSGMVAENNSFNAVSATGGSVNITSSGAEGIAAYENSANTLSVSGGNVNIKSAWAGVGASGDSTNTISVTNGSVNIATDTWGITTSNNSTANVDVTNGSLSIDALGRGIHSYGDSTNTVHVTNGDVNVNSGSGWEGIIAHFGSTNNVTVDGGSVHIAAAGNGVGAFYDSTNNIAVNGGSLNINADGAGVKADSGSLNSVAVTGGDILINSTSSYDAAVVAYDGKNTIDAGTGTLTVNGATKGISAENGGKNNLSGKDISIGGTGGEAVYASGSESKNTIGTGTTATIEINGSTKGLAASSGGVNSVTANDVSVKGTYGLYSEGANSKNLISSGVDGHVSVIGSKGLAAFTGGTNSITGGNTTVDGGIYAQGQNSKNEIISANGTVNIKGFDAVMANVSSTNSITAKHVSITGASTGLNATNGKNEITVGRDGNVAITATNAMFIQSMNGKNYVSGGNVTVEGKSSGMYVSGTNSNGENRIDAGTDGVVSVKGNIAMQSLGGTNSVIGGKITVAATGTGLHSENGGKNSLTGGDVTINGTGNSSYAMRSIGSGSANSVTGTGAVEVNGVKYGMSASSGGQNIVTGNSVLVASTGTGGNALDASGSGSKNSVDAGRGTVTIRGGMGLSANSGGENSVAGGHVSITSNGTGYGAFATGSGSKNTVTAGSDGTASISGSTGLYAANAGKNIVTGGDVSITGTTGYAVFATDGQSKNSIDAGSNGTVSVSGKYGLYANNSGVNAVSGGNIVVVGTGTSNSALYTSGTQSENSITASSGGTVSIRGDSGITAMGGTNRVTGGDITIAGTGTGSNSYGIFTSSGSTTITGSSDGTVSISGRSGLSASGSGGSNTVTGGSININGTVYGAIADGVNNVNTIAAGSGGKVSIGGNLGLFANSGGKNTVSGGDITITGAGAYNAGVYSYGAQSTNTVDAGTTGKVSISGTYGLETFGGKNVVNGGDIVITGTSVGAAAMSASGGSNTVTSGTGGTVSVNGGSGMMAANGGANTITGNTVSIVGNDFGLHAEDSGSASVSGPTNTVQSASGPLSVTITATADSAQKAIAMWADGGRAVNYITGHSQSGGAGDNITLNGGIAMQTANGGRNIITTGAGNDHVTINGAVKGSGNQINVGGGSNTVTLNGAVETGSLNVIATGGTYTLILQASSTESFAERYGQWLNSIAADGLIAGGLTSISFDGLDMANLPADFLAAFNDLLHDLHSSGISIEPAGLFDHLHDPAAAAAPMMFVAADAAEHNGTDSIHVVGDDGQDAHAAGLGTVQGHDAPNTAGTHTVDEAGSVAVIGSGGAESSHPDGSASAQDTSAQGDNADTHQVMEHDVTGGAEHAVDGAAHDALQNQDGLLSTGAHPQLDTHMAENTDSVTSSTESGHEDSPVLDDLLSDHSFYGSENVGLLFHGDSLNQLDGGPASDVTTNHSGEVHADIVLSQGDVSLDSLFGERSMSSDEYGSMHQDGDSATNMAGMSLADMHTAVTVDAPAENANVTHGDSGTGSSMIDGGAAAPAWDNVQSSVENSLQETANTAMRQIEAC